MSERLAQHLSALLRRIEPRAGNELETAVAALFNGLNEGHVCLDSTVVPEIEALLPALQRLPAIVGGAGTPLIVEGKRLYLARYREYEASVAEALRVLARPVEPPPDPARLEEVLRLLYGAEVPDPHQAAAVRGAAQRNLAIISGGPGTGKTTTVARVLAARQLLAPPGASLRIALAAPTGKAADRLRLSVAEAKRSLSIPEQVKQLIPEEASTLHRLLGIRPGFTMRDRTRPLQVDLLVIDEASMIDLSLMAKVLDALPPGAGLILLGDRDQLDAVQPGSVFGDLSRGIDEGVLANAVFTLTKSYRFAPASGISLLAKAVNAGDIDAAIGVLRNDPSGQIVWIETELPEDDPQLVEQVLSWLRPYFGMVRAGATPGDCFAAFNRCRLLTPLREGPADVRSMNERIAGWIRRDGVDVAEWYPGRPLLVDVNSYALRLFNGDVGITVPGADGDPGVVFPGEAGTWRRFSPARLPAHEPAYACTVHKSQGSEYDVVLLLVPPGDAPVITRNLLYTGVTRARQRCVIWGSERSLRMAIGRRPVRASGLWERLRDV